MMIHEITDKVGKYKSRKRLGRGQGSGLGKTSGRGHKGAGSRAGFSNRPYREGGQMVWARRIPKRGFSNFAFADNFQIVNVQALEAHCENGQTVDAALLCSLGLVRNATDPLKVLGEGELKKKLTVKAAKFSGSAREKITAAGGSVEEIVKKVWARQKPEKGAKKKKA